MLKLKTFFRSFIKSSINSDYYNHVVETRFSFSFKYFVFLHFLLALIIMARVTVVVSKFDATAFISNLSQLYPEELVLTVDDDGVSINQDLPYSLVTLDEAVQVFGDEELSKIVADADTQDWSLAKFDSDENIQGLDDVLDAKALVVITESSIYILEDADTGEIKAYPMSGIEGNYSISQSSVDIVVDQLSGLPVIKQKLYVPFIAVSVLLLAWAGGLWLRFIVVAFYSLLVKIAVTLFMKTKKLSYVKVLQIGLHSITPVIVIKWSADLLQISYKGWLSILLFMAWTLYVISRLSVSKKSPVRKVKRKSRKK